MKEEEIKSGEGSKACCGGESYGWGKTALFFIVFLALAIGYYLSIDYILMVFAQNLPFPYKG